MIVAQLVLLRECVAAEAHQRRRASELAVSVSKAFDDAAQQTPRAPAAQPSPHRERQGSLSTARRKARASTDGEGAPAATSPGLPALDEEDGTDVEHASLLHPRMPPTSRALDEEMELRASPLLRAARRAEVFLLQSARRGTPSSRATSSGSHGRTRNPAADDEEPFWGWSTMGGFVNWLLRLALCLSVLTLAFGEQPLFAEGVGALALFVEALLGVPQLVRNAQAGSTQGLRFVVWVVAGAEGAEGAA